MKRLPALLFCLAVSASAVVAHAQPAPAGQTPAAVAAAQPLTSGEVRKIDASQGKITLRHEAIANLDMPAMTMVFRAAKPELLRGLTVGDKVRFRAEDVAGVLTLTEVNK